VAVAFVLDLERAQKNRLGFGIPVLSFENLSKDIESPKGAGMILTKRSFDDPQGTSRNWVSLSKLPLGAVNLSETD
jgi:hypothetical protein